MTSSTNQKQQANFFISIETIENLKKNIPQGKQSMFVEEAIKKELQRKKFLAILHGSAAWKEKNHPENTEKFIRSLRESKRI